MAPIQHSVDLSWSERSSSKVQGYKVYRAGVSGGPYAAVVSANPGTTFVDGFVQSGSKIPLTAARSDGLPIAHAQIAAIAQVRIEPLQFLVWGTFRKC